MLLTDNAEASELLENSENLVNKLGIRPIQIEHLNIRKFRHTGSKGKKVPSELRPLIAALATVEGTTQTAKDFGTALPTVNNFKHGKSSNDVPDAKLESDTAKILGTVRDLAADRLLAAIGLLDNDRLAGVTKATEISAIAANLSRVVEKVTPKLDQTNGPVFHVYAPELRTLDRYEVIDVGTTNKLDKGSHASDKIQKS